MTVAVLTEGSNAFSDLGFKVANTGLPAGSFTSKSIRNAITSAASPGAVADCDINIITSANATTTYGVQLVATVQNGIEQRVVNNGGTIQTVYPPTGGQIDAGGANVGVTIAAAANSGKTFLQTGSLTYITSSLT